MMFDLFNIKQIAPTLLSDTIELAVEDLEVVEEDKTYKVVMTDWHMERYRGKSASKCEVCLAGAVMAVTLRVPWELSINAHDFSSTWSNVFTAINNVRTGLISNALARFTGKRRDNDWVKDFAKKHGFKTRLAALTWYEKACGNKVKRKLVVAEYDKAPVRFKKQMLVIAAGLREEGL